MTDERCGGRRCSPPRRATGSPRDPIYKLSPVLHEPAPRSMNVVTSADRLGGQPRRSPDGHLALREYEPAQRRHGDHAPLHRPGDGGRGRARRRPPTCRRSGSPSSARPAATRRRSNSPSCRRSAPTAIARPIADLTGPIAVRAGDAAVKVRNAAFTPAPPLGPQRRGRPLALRRPVQHDVTLASGPRGFASAYTVTGTYRKRLTAPGQYRIFCSLHPVTMSQTIEVRP